MAPSEPKTEAMEHHGSPWPILLASGSGAMFVSFALFGPVLLTPLFLVGLVVFGGSVAGWALDDYRGRRVPHVPGEREGKEGTLEAFATRKAAMWIFLASEIMFFSGIIGGSWAVRVQAEEWVAPGAVLNVPLTALNTFILIASSLVMAEALHAVQQGKQRELVLRLFLVLALGLVFISIQAFEYIGLIHDGLTPWGSPEGPAAYGATFYMQTGFHGAHVTGGIVGLAYVTAKAAKGAFTAENHLTVELMGLYWHFVDVVWIFLFTIVYLV